MMDPVAALRAKIHTRSPLVRNLLSEFFGTFMLLFIGIAIVMQFILSHEKLNTWIQVNIGWGFAIAFCVYLTAKTSGGHLNPAVTVLMWSFGKLPLAHVFIYSVVQTIAAFFGSAAAYFVYYDQFVKYAGNVRAIVGVKATAGSFCSFAPAHISNTTAFVDQFVGTALLCLFVAAIVDRRNRIPDFLHPLLFGFVVMMIGCSYGLNLGYPINPARDLGPRIFAYFIYGGAVFSHHNYYFWIPVIAPLFGGVFGGWMYHLFIGAHIADPVEEARNGEDEALVKKAAV